MTAINKYNPELVKANFIFFPILLFVVFSSVVKLSREEFEQVYASLLKCVWARAAMTE